MRTKTLLLTAALSAAGVASSLAQAVYSVNAVGYVNTTIVPKFNLVSNPLNNTEANGNTIKSLFASLPFGTQVYKFNGTGFDIATKDDLVGDYDPAPVANATVTPGQGVFVLNNGTQTHTVTFVGEVPQGNPLTVNIPAGFSIISSPVPQAGNIQTDLGFTPAGGDQLYFWDEATQKYTIHTWDAEFASWDINPPNLGVGEAIFIRKNAAGVWNRNFSVNN
jgi:hypothetical protein